MRDFAKFVEQLVTACPAVRYVRLYIKEFERQKQKALKRSEKNFGMEILISPVLQESFNWWLEYINNSNKFKPLDFKHFFDASNTG